MAGLLSAANLGGIADARLGSEADAIGTTQEHRGSINHMVAPPDTHGHNTIYLDDSINFETYHYWANRSRDFEKRIRTDNAGLRQVANLVVGKKIKDEAPQIDTPPEKVAGTNLSEKGSDGAGNGERGLDAHGISETEWEMAQRATRTATWGESSRSALSRPWTHSDLFQQARSSI